MVPYPLYLENWLNLLWICIYSIPGPSVSKEQYLLEFELELLSFQSQKVASFDLKEVKEV